MDTFYVVIRVDYQSERNTYQKYEFRIFNRGKRRCRVKETRFEAKNEFPPKFCIDIIMQFFPQILHRSKGEFPVTYTVGDTACVW